MSRTFRRKEFSPSDIAKYGYLYGENDVWVHYGEPKWKNNFYRYNKEVESFKEYRDLAVSTFHRDAGTRYFVNYGSAPWCCRNLRNRALRTIHRNELYRIKQTGDGDLTPFIHNVGWDYW